MDLSFKNQFPADDYKPSKPGQVAISSLLGIFSQLTNLGGLARPRMQGSYSVDKEIALNQAREQQINEMSMRAIEFSLRVMASTLQTETNI